MPTAKHLPASSSPGVLVLVGTTKGAFLLRSSWKATTAGLPQEGAYETVLRDALAVDTLDPAGVYFGTRRGEVWASASEGDTWRMAVGGLPPVVCVKAVVLEGAKAAKQPAARVKKPAARAKQPAARAKKPAARAKQPAARVKKPAAKTKKKQAR